MHREPVGRAQPAGSSHTEESMAREFAEAFYKSKAWTTTRALYILQVGGLCEDCMAKGIYRPGKIVHHRKHLTPENINNPNIALGFDNLKLVCQDCHAAEHAKDKGLRYSFDADGNLILPAEELQG